MSHTTEAIWICDICEKTVVQKDDYVPPNWFHDYKLTCSHKNYCDRYTKLDCCPECMDRIFSIYSNNPNKLEKNDIQRPFFQRFFRRE